jgi:hypothetical protein
MGMVRNPAGSSSVVSNSALTSADADCSADSPVSGCEPESPHPVTPIAATADTDIAVTRNSDVRTDSTP